MIHDGDAYTVLKKIVAAWLRGVRADSSRDFELINFS